MDPTRLSLNTATVPRADLAQVVDLAVRHEIRTVAPWRHLLTDLGAERAGDLLRDAGIAVSSLCRGGLFTHPDAAGRAAAVDENRRAVDEAHAIGAPVLVLVCGPVVGSDVDGSFSMVRDGIGAVLDHARAAGVRLGIEPLHPMMAADRSVVTRLDDAVELVDALGGDGLGVVVDAYHVWWERHLHDLVARLADRVCGLHVSDWVSPLTGGLLSGRGMMGDGHIDLPGLAAASGWTGPVEVEVISDTWAERPLDETVATAVDRFRRHV